ncbi:Alpha galactosidase A [Sphingomonas sp. NFR04]|uniref:NPCBM/NEW2 domain-containing protein n=1 Tax=Sphingomonas sp. NFR04 TaxID=1566283 RepID=UPI0008E56620|nr:NPCBM/NEW2 domain-containing protein [Sphingomonas sp. NFR04]SFK56415.1 Alpha galactosidase A [Sphingomonas sp. NFR04]
MAIKTLAGISALLLASASAQSAPRDPLAPTGRWSANTDGRAPTPPMGWNSWNAFATDVDEEKVLASAQKIVDTGLAAKGYRYINLDEGWWDHRRADGRMLVRADKFPSARTADGATSFKPLTDRLHAMGLKAGIYTDLGRNTCAQAYGPNEPQLPRGSVLEREVGLYGHIDQDIGLYFGEWGFDYIKIDGCGLRAYGEDSPLVREGRYRALAPILDLDSINRSNIPAVRAMFAQVKAALVRADPDQDYLLSLCIWGSADVRSWAKDVGNISRTSDDITPHWTRLLTNFDTAARRPLYAHPGSWNDPDMLFIGKGEFDADHLVEARSHFALWAMVSAPLLIGADLRTTPQALMDIFGNAALIAIDQDPAGNQAVLAFDTDDFQILVKTLANGDKAVALFNRTAAPTEAILTAQHLKLRDDAPIALTDLWTGGASSFTKETKFKLAPHETLVFRAKGTRLLADGLYLSEMPGSVNPAVDGVTAPMADPTIHRAIVSWSGTRGAGQRPLYAGWGGAQADATPYGRELAVAGAHFAAGLGVLANSRLEVRNAGYRQLTVSVGVDDSATDATHAVTFQIYGDRRLLATSAPIRRGGAAKPLRADVAGVKLVELVARSGGAANERLPVVWGDAALRR